MGEMKKAKEFEKNLEYGRGIIPTPQRWISYFWDVHRKKVVEYLEPFVKGADSIVFIGVGGGDILPFLSIRDKIVLGLDLNLKFLTQSTRYCSALVADGAMMPVKDESVDLVICDLVLHHIVGQGDLEKSLAECSRVLKNGGRLLVFEPNFFHPSGMAMNLLNKFRLYYKVAGGSDYEFALSPFQVARVCRSHFMKVKIRAITFSHPRFPPFVQKLFFRADRHLSRFYPLSFSFMLEALKG
jgi:ubiquinone/menaquinone biosynthesis C-methylase UbiE